MPGRARSLLIALGMVMAVGLLALGCKGGASGPSTKPGVDQEARDKIALIEKFLGTPKGDAQKELLASIESNNKYLREVIQDLKCEIYMLKQPTGTTKPDPCPPEGPSSSPTTAPRYPPQ